MIAIVNIPVRIEIGTNVIISKDGTKDAYTITMFEITHEPIIGTPYFKVNIKHLGNDAIRDDGKRLKDLELIMNYEDLKTLFSEPTATLNSIYYQYDDDISRYQFDDYGEYIADDEYENDDEDVKEIQYITDQWFSDDGSKSVYLVHTKTDEEFTDEIQEILNKELGYGNYVYTFSDQAEKIKKDIEVKNGSWAGIIPTMTDAEAVDKNIRDFLNSIFDEHHENEDDK